MLAKPPRPPWPVLAAVALVSFCILAAEVALTRVFSVLFRAPYVFLIVSGATGGLGMGGLLVQFLKPREESLGRWITGLSVLLAAALAAPVLLLFASPWGKDLVANAEAAVVVTVPMATFMVAGVLLALVFRRYAASGGLLYFVDLCAAGLAAPAAVLLLDTLGGLNTPLALGAAAAAAGGLVALGARLRGWAAVSAVTCAALAVVTGSNLASRWIDLPVLRTPSAALQDPGHPWHSITKPLFAELGSPFSASRIVRTDWNAVSRTDVVYDPGQSLYYVYTDGDVPTQMEAWDGKPETARGTYSRFIGVLPYRLRSTPPQRVMAIGSGGGLDVLLALAAGAQHVDAVEINPSIPRVVADPRFAGTYARVYQDARVTLAVDEGRSFLQRSGKYDVIYFACAKTATTQTSGVALLDNHLYTVEAFRDYWRHLSEDGVVSLVVQEPFLLDRLTLTALTMLRQEGLSPAESALHVLTARVPESRQMFAGPYRQVLVLRRRAWQPAELERTQRALAATGLEPVTVPIIRPQGGGGGIFDPGAPLPEIRRALEAQYPVPANLENPQDSRTVPANLAAVTDDSPFYVDIARGLHPTLRNLLAGSGIATLVVLLAVGIPGALPQRRESLEGEGPARFPLPRLGAGLVYFSMLGAGFMLVELALMQRFILLLGFPTRSLTVTLFALLVSCSLGSYVTQRGAAAASAKRLLLVLPALALLLAAYRFLLPGILDALLPLPLWGRMLATGALLFPAGFLMGMPFPTALRALEDAPGSLIPGFWSVNGVTSILGSVLAMAIAKFAGYGGALLVGAGCYLAAWAVWPVLAARRERPETAPAAG